MPTLSSQARTLTVWMSAGSRPATAESPNINIYLNDTLLGTATATSTFQPYQFEIPAGVASGVEETEDPAILRLECTTWSPRALLGTADGRELGVMVDRVAVE